LTSLALGALQSKIPLGFCYAAKARENILLVARNFASQCNQTSCYHEDQTISLIFEKDYSTFRKKNIFATP